MAGKDHKQMSEQIYFSDLKKSTAFNCLVFPPTSSSFDQSVCLIEITKQTKQINKQTLSQYIEGTFTSYFIVCPAGSRKRGHVQNPVLGRVVCCGCLAIPWPSARQRFLCESALTTFYWANNHLTWKNCFSKPFRISFFNFDSCLLKLE